LVTGAATDFAFAAGTHTNAAVSYTDSTGNAVNVTGNGNVVNFGGELNGVSLTLGQSGTSINSIGGSVAATPGQAFTFQIGANENQTASINFRSMLAGGLGVVGNNNLANIKVDSASNAQTALASIDQAISDVANTRGTLGAFQANTLEVNANNLRVGLDNTTAAESTIRDTDFASEIATYTKNQTLMQAGSTVLGNANQITQLVAGLLRG
jgi:flagellin